MSRGILYIATGETFLKESKVSAESLKEYNDLEVAVITSSEFRGSEHDLTVFDDVIYIEQEKLFADLRDKVRNIDATIYEKTVFLDTDTYVLGDLSPMFDILEKVDLVAAHAPVRPLVSLSDVPDTFPELNTGVLGYCSNEGTHKLFQKWKRIHKDQLKNGRPNERVTLKGVDRLENLASFGRMHDQPPFREALYKSDVRFCALPREYNFRGSGTAYGRVKVLHMGHGIKGKRVKKSINKDTHVRTYVDQRGKVFFENGKNERISYKLIERAYKHDRLNPLFNLLKTYKSRWL